MKQFIRPVCNSERALWNRFVKNGRACHFGRAKLLQSLNTILFSIIAANIGYHQIKIHDAGKGECLFRGPCRFNASASVRRSRLKGRLSAGALSTQRMVAP